MPQCHPDDSSALLQLIHGSFSPSSPCFTTTTWIESTNCCTWDGITCDRVTGHVIGLELFCRSLKGFHVPLEISHLSKLVNLTLDGCDQIKLGDDTFKALAKNLTNLRVLDFSYIDMSSVSPVSLTNLSSSLTFLSLHSSNLHGELPENIFQMPKLEVLVLRGNNLNGQIPCFFLNLRRLRTIDLSSNNFSGQLPKVCSNSSQKYPPLGSSNYLVGNAPSNLTSLSLGSNSLHGTIPSWIYELPYLEELRLGGNLFTGEVGEFQSTSLRILSLGGNKLHGMIPRSIFHQAELTGLYLSSNNLTGIVEFEKLSKLKKLEGVNLSSNNLSFNFNNSINYTLDNLWTLGLSSCNISEFPHFLRYSIHLYRLDLSFNQIPGSVPNWLWEVSKNSMSHLNLSHNYLTQIEPLPMYRLLILDLSSNFFSGPLPIPLAPSLLYFVVSKNQFSGDIPTSICTMTSLWIVDLSLNNLSGNIPQCMGHFSTSLTVVDLRMNKLHGPIPATFAKGNSLRYINLNGNELEGPLPRSLEHCRYLEVLDVGNNQLRDTFPDWLESLPELQVLVLRANKFYGSIENPKTRSPFRQLRIIDVAYNEFRGALPIGYIKNFKAMMDTERVKMEYMKTSYMVYFFYSIVVSMKGIEVELVKIQTILTTIDFSSNNFTGEIPKLIGRLESLKGLNFSHNKLQGTIPSSLGNLTNLEWLDLSSNELVGRIPDQLVGIPWLASLNLSLNKLVGPIPSGRQFNTFNNGSFSGNPGLCGFPLSKLCGNREAQPNQGDDREHDEGMFDWKVVMMGYASGVVIGISVGYMVLFSRSGDHWFMKRLGRERRHISIAPLAGWSRRRN